ncbi:MAG: MerR family transcriptional regulator [Actinophytocola sp.]|nr:MerR family transcriptional regulator [Actinophytocola sp.]
MWTIEQLPDQVAALLADNYDGQSNGRVRELPNGRTIRWYTTIGLVDRPLATSGRTARYGRRHLLQLVVVKQLQAAGHTLAEIQERLVGASDGRLNELAGLPPIDIVSSRPNTTITGNFWKHTNARPTAEATPDEDTVKNTVTRMVPGIHLGDSVTVVLHAATRAPDADELAAIGEAAAPLLELLGRMGLAPTTGGESR